MTDKITVKIRSHPELDDALYRNNAYICSEILAQSFDVTGELPGPGSTLVEITDTISTDIEINRVDQHI